VDLLLAGGEGNPTLAGHGGTSIQIIGPSVGAVCRKVMSSSPVLSGRAITNGEGRLASSRLYDA
jgi:hypothetical protein